MALKAPKQWVCLPPGFEGFERACFKFLFLKPAVGREVDDN